MVWHQVIVITCTNDDCYKLDPNEQKLNLNKKANLRDSIAGTGLVIFYKLDSNHRFFYAFDFQI